ncbi:hypothetical protein JFT66_10460 [Pseudomonas sp. MF6755]|uniref:hypothetical protein n=1 Tax=Pseudomonas sp. MF6755 TaxID=2797530 RepID=UPI0018E859F8|nr:hypothetical protein [Pseudomonas sp. MF6755]MBJ2284571.1 hypothetical protein [Pseudomonas sp. MF6755]
MAFQLFQTASGCIEKNPTFRGGAHDKCARQFNRVLAGHVQLQGLDVHRHFLRLAQRIGGQVHGVEPVEVLEGKMACALAVAQLRAVGWGFAEKIR